MPGSQIYFNAWKTATAFWCKFSPGPWLRANASSGQARNSASPTLDLTSILIYTKVVTACKNRPYGETVQIILTADSRAPGIEEAGTGCPRRPPAPPDTCGHPRRARFNQPHDAPQNRERRSGRLH